MQIPLRVLCITTMIERDDDSKAACTNGKDPALGSYAISVVRVENEKVLYHPVLVGSQVLAAVVTNNLIEQSHPPNAITSPVICSGPVYYYSIINLIRYTGVGLTCALLYRYLQYQKYKHKLSNNKSYTRSFCFGVVRISSSSCSVLRIVKPLVKM